MSRAMLPFAKLLWPLFYCCYFFQIHYSISIALSCSYSGRQMYKHGCVQRFAAML